MILFAVAFNYFLVPSFFKKMYYDYFYFYWAGVMYL